MANVTIAPDAITAKYDAVVTTAGGKKGIGSELFTVTLQAEALAGGTIAQHVNAAGVAVGVAPSVNCAAGIDVPMLWQADGSPVPLPLDGGCAGAAYAINNAGVVLGEISFSTSSSMPVLWTPSGSGYIITQLGAAPDGVIPSTLGALNDSGQVVGSGTGNQMYWWSPATGWVAMPSPVGATLCYHSQAPSPATSAGPRSTAASREEAYRPERRPLVQPCDDAGAPAPCVRVWGSHADGYQRFGSDRWRLAWAARYGGPGLPPVTPSLTCPIWATEVGRVVHQFGRHNRRRCRDQLICTRRRALAGVRRSNHWRVTP